jgi:hypothetical protein
MELLTLVLLIIYSIQIGSELKGTTDHCGRGARAKKAHPLHIHNEADTVKHYAVFKRKQRKLECNYN